MFILKSDQNFLKNVSEVNGILGTAQMSGNEAVSGRGTILERI
jgi:hypothetical protein